jgi:DNA-binding beta-propeller fold protein YncE
VRRATLCAAAGLAGVSLVVACRAGPGAGGGATQASCGDRERIPEKLPPFPEPARSPELAERPTGRVLRLPGRPEGLAFDASTGRLAVGLNEPRGQLLFVDGETGSTLRRVPLPAGPRHLRFARPGGPVLVPAEGANALVQVPQDRAVAVRAAVGRQPHDATAGAGGRVFVVNEHDSSMSVVERDRVICTLPTPANPGGVAADEVGGRVGAVGVRANTLRLYDARTLHGLGEVGAGIGPTHVVSNGKRTLHVADTRGDAIISIRTRPRLELYSRQALPNSAPYGLAYDLRRRELWITSTARNRVVLFRNQERIRSFPTVRQPNAVAVDERTGRVFVAGRYEQLQLIDPPQDSPALGRSPRNP